MISAWLSFVKRACCINIFNLISPYVICFTIIFMLSIILIYVVPLLRKYLLPHIYKHVPFCNFSLYLKKAGLASRNIVQLNLNSTLYRSLLQSLQFIFVKPIRATLLIQRTQAGLLFAAACLDITV